MTGLLVGLQFSSWMRDRRLLALLMVMALALVAASAWATAGDISQREAQLAAASTAREQWEGRGDAHPHSMAHFGDFAFRPTGPLARLDRGVQARLGKVLRIEGHRQGTPLHSDAARAGSVARFDTPDAAFLLQTVVPLLLIFLGATGLASDRETGRLKLSLVQGASARSVLGGHFLALWSLSLGLLALVLLASLATSSFLGAQAAPAGARLAGFALVHALFLAVVAAGVVAAAVSFRSARSALLALLAAWVFATALLPRATASAATALYPLPSQDAFQDTLRAAREAGPDGHNPEDEKGEQRRQEGLLEYGVTSEDDLPINFGGIAMQLDEEFGNQVWDEHYGALRQTLDQQVSLGGMVSLVNPFQAIDHVSMALAGTDLAHDLDFQNQAEAYRRSLVEKLNNEHAYGGSTAGDRSWKATAAFFAGLDAFHYTSPAVAAATSHRRSELISLVLWLAVLVLVLRRSADRLARGQLPC